MSFMVTISGKFRTEILKRYRIKIICKLIWYVLGPFEIDNIVFRCNRCVRCKRIRLPCDLCFIILCVCVRCVTVLFLYNAIILYWPHSRSEALSFVVSRIWDRIEYLKSVFLIRILNELYSVQVSHDVSFFGFLLFDPFEKCIRSNTASKREREWMRVTECEWICDNQVHHNIITANDTHKVQSKTKMLW